MTTFLTIYNVVIFYYYTVMASSSAMLQAWACVGHLSLTCANIFLLLLLISQKEFEARFGLYRVAVDYCYFGWEEKKPTLLWVNDIRLVQKLQEFRCKEPFGDDVHLGVWGNGSKYDFGRLCISVGGFCTLLRRYSSNPSSGCLQRKATTYLFEWIERQRL